MDQLAFFSVRKITWPLTQQDRFITCFKTCGTSSLNRGRSGGSKSLWCLVLQRSLYIGHVLVNNTWLFIITRRGNILLYWSCFIGSRAGTQTRDFQVYSRPHSAIWATVLRWESKNSWHFHISLFSRKKAGNIPEETTFWHILSSTNFATQI